MQQPTTSNRLRPFRPTPFGRYTLLMPLQMGGMGEIFLARIDGPQGFEKLCVIKKILPHLAEDKDFVSRFGNEARTLVKLTHGSIAQVLDMGQQNGEPYLALEYIDGKDLRKVGARFRERGMPVPPTFVLFVMGRVLDALAYAHRKRDDDDKEIGLVHRDMSPQNILISYEGEVKVIDFGLAKSTLNHAKTNPSIILGKFLYMSPEQAKHAKVDKRSDLYAVGICLYELIAGKNPFEEVPPHALMAAVATPNIAHVQQIDPLVPTNIAQIIMKALAVDPAQRFQTAEELRGKLLGALLEIDPSAGPESCSRFMRDMFAAEYQSERKLLAQMKEAARLEARPDTTLEAPAVRPSQVRPLAVAKPNPRLEPPPADESTPAPTDLRRYGMEPTMPRGVAIEPSALSFAPTPKVGGDASDQAHEGDRETVPGVVIDRNLVVSARATGADEDRETGPHPAAFSEGLGEDAPTRPVPMGPRLATPGLISLPQRLASSTANATTAPSMEPVTTETNVVPGPPDQDLPSVMVTGMQSQAVPVGRATTGSTRLPPQNRPLTSQVLVPAASVRTPAVVAPLPKALEGKSRPDENLITDRTRAKRTSMFVVIVPLIAFLGLAGFVGLSIVRENNQAELDDQPGSTSPHGMPSLNDNQRLKPKDFKSSEEGVEPSAEPNIQPVDPPEEDTLAKLPAPTPPPEKPRPVPKTKAGKDLERVRAHFIRVEKSHLQDEKTINGWRQKLQTLEDRLPNQPPNGDAKFNRDLNELKAALERAK